MQTPSRPTLRRVTAKAVRVREDGATASHVVGPNATMPRLDVRRIPRELMLPRHLQRLLAPASR